MSDRTGVLVLGAGFAGLACASALRRARVDVRVLEARDRVGGRVWTLRDFADGAPIEAGAMMIHGRHAAVHRWASEFRLSTRLVPMLRGGRIFDGGRLRSTLGFALGGLDRIRTVLEMQRSLPRAIERYDGPDVTLAEFLVRRRASPRAARFVATMYGSINGADPGELSVRGLAEEALVSSFGLPWRNYQVLEGIQTIADRRARELGDDILLGRRVERVEWSPDGVRVHASGPEGPEVHAARAAVVALPLGVLKAGDVAFDPGLPEEKRQTIDVLGYGDVNKVLLVFDEAARATVLGKAVFLAKEEGDWYFLPYAGRRTGPVVIEGFLGGSRARAVAGRPESEVVREVLDVLSAMVPGFDFRRHLRAARFIDWTSDPFSRGGYSFPSLGGGLEARRRLAAPLAGVLFFAGEATHAGGEHATIHGAIDSGERAAGEVLAALRAGGPG